MITLTFDFPTAYLETQAVEELASHFGYSATITTEVDSGETVTLTLPDGTTTTVPKMVHETNPNPQSKLDFCKRKVADMLGEIIRKRIVAKVALQAEQATHEALSATVIT